MQGKCHDKATWMPQHLVPTILSVQEITRCPPSHKSAAPTLLRREPNPDSNSTGVSKQTRPFLKSQSDLQHQQNSVKATSEAAQQYQPANLPNVWLCSFSSPASSHEPRQPCLCQFASEDRAWHDGGAGTHRAQVQRRGYSALKLQGVVRAVPGCQGIVFYHSCRASRLVLNHSGK